MGGICSKGFVAKDLTVRQGVGKNIEEPDVFPVPERYDSGELRVSYSGKLKGTTPARLGSSKVPEGSSLLGRAGIVGLERAVEVLDTLGSSMSNFNPSSGFVSGMATRGNKISILAFEVANTIVKGSNLMQSLSKENVQFLKKEILTSEGVQNLVSTDPIELLAIAAADKREELEVFAREVQRFGNLCKDPQWHNLGRYFQKLDLDFSPHKLQKEDAEITMQQLTSLAHHTSELYHELHALDRFEQDYRRKVQEEEALHVTRRGESLMILHSELKRQRKLVRSLKKKSLWFKSLEEVTEKLVDIVTFLHQEIMEAFGSEDARLMNNSPQNHQRLGSSGLALHYANIIIQIDNIVSRPSSVPPNMRGTLYHGLPSGVKATLRSRLQSFEAEGELTVSKIKAEMEKTLQWIVLIAQNTTKAHQGFGWVGEWANTSNDFNQKTSTHNIIRLQTLHHAQKDKTDEYLLELVTWLHQLVSKVKQRDHGFRSLVPNKSPNRNGSLFSLLSSEKQNPSPASHRKTDFLSQEDIQMLEEVSHNRKMIPGRSKSQEFVLRKKRVNRQRGLSRSSGNSPARQFTAVLSLELERGKALDIIDGLDRNETLTV